MFVKVFVLGRPGSGKSTAIQHITKLANRRAIHTTTIKDYTILRMMFEHELEQDIEPKRFQPADWDGFDVTDFSVLDEALERLEMGVEMMENLFMERKTIVLIEFARNDYYKALNNFTHRFLKDAYFLFIDAQLEEACIERIHKRRAGTSLSEDRHSVSDTIMRSYYATHNWSFALKMLSVENRSLQHVTTLDNNGSTEEFEQKIHFFAENLFAETAFEDKYSMLSV